MDPFKQRSGDEGATNLSGDVKHVLQSPLASSSAGGLAGSTGSHNFPNSSNNNNNCNSSSVRGMVTLISPIHSDPTSINLTSSQEETKLRSNAEAARSTSTPQLTLSESPVVSLHHQLFTSPREQSSVVAATSPEAREAAGAFPASASSAGVPGQIAFGFPRREGDASRAAGIVTENSDALRNSEVAPSRDRGSASATAATAASPFVLEGDRRASGLQNQLFSAGASSKGPRPSPPQSTPLAVFEGVTHRMEVSSQPRASALSEDRVSGVAQTAATVSPPRFAGPAGARSTTDIFFTAPSVSYLLGTPVDLLTRARGQDNSEEEDASDEAAIQAAIDAAACFDDFSSSEEDESGKRNFRADGGSGYGVEDKQEGEETSSHDAWRRTGVRAEVETLARIFGDQAASKQQQHEPHHCCSSSGDSAVRKSAQEEAMTDTDARRGFFGSALGSTTASRGTSVGRESVGRHNAPTPLSGRAVHLRSGHRGESPDFIASVTSQGTAQSSSQPQPQPQQVLMSSKADGMRGATPTSLEAISSDSVFPPRYGMSGSTAGNTLRTVSGYDSATVTSGSFLPQGVLPTPQHQRQLSARMLHPSTGHQSGLPSTPAGASAGPSTTHPVVPTAGPLTTTTVLPPAAAAVVADHHHHRGRSFSISSLTSPPSSSLPLPASTSYDVLQQQPPQQQQYCAVRRDSFSSSSNAGGSARANAHGQHHHRFVHQHQNSNISVPGGGKEGSGESGAGAGSLVHTESGTYLCVSPPPTSFVANSPIYGVPAAGATAAMTAGTTATGAGGGGAMSLASHAASAANTARATAVNSLLSSPSAPTFQAYQMPQATLVAEQQQQQQQQQQQLQGSVNASVLLYSPPQAYDGNSNTTTTHAALTPNGCGGSLTAPPTTYQLPAATQQQQQQKQQQSQIVAGCTLTPSLSASAAADAATTSIQSSRASRNLYFRNLPRSWNTTVLRELCSNYGAVMSAKVAHHPVTNESLGYGFVLFENTQSAAVCVATLNHALIRAEGEETRTLLVRMAHPSAAPGFREDPDEATASGRSDTSTHVLSGAQQQQQQQAPQQGTRAIPQPPSASVLLTSPLPGALAHRGATSTRGNAVAGGASSSVFTTTDLTTQPTSVLTSPRSHDSNSVSARPLSPTSVTMGSSRETSAVYAPEMRQPYSHPPHLTSAATATAAGGGVGRRTHADDQGDLPSFLCPAPSVEVPAVASPSNSTHHHAHTSSHLVSEHVSVLSPPGVGMSHSLPAPGPLSLSTSATHPQHPVPPPQLATRPLSAGTPGTLRGAVASPLTLSPNADSGLMTPNQMAQESSSSVHGNSIINYNSVSHNGGVPLSKNSSFSAAIAPSSATSTRNLYITNLPLTWNTTKLRDLCAQFGTIVSANVAHHPKTNESRGYGFVLFAEEADAAACVRGLHQLHVPDTAHTLCCRFAKDKATPSIAHVTSVPMTHASPLTTSETVALQKEPETGKSLVTTVECLSMRNAKGAVDAASQGTSAVKAAAAKSAGDDDGGAQRTLASSCSLKDAVMMPIEVFSTLQERVASQAALYLQSQQIQQQHQQGQQQSSSRTRTPADDANVANSSKPQTPPLSEKSCETAASGRSDAKAELSAAQKADVETLMQHCVVYGAFVPRHGCGCVRPAEAFTLGYRSPLRKSSPCTQTPGQAMDDVMLLRGNSRESSFKEFTRNDNNSNLNANGSSGRGVSCESSTSAAGKADVTFGDVLGGNSCRAGGVVCTCAIPVPARMRSPSTSIPPNEALSGNTHTISGNALSEKHDGPRVSSSCESRSNDNAGILPNSAAATPPSAGSASLQAEWWYTCTLFVTAEAAEAFLQEFAAMQRGEEEEKEEAEQQAVGGGSTVDAVQLGITPTEQEGTSKPTTRVDAAGTRSSEAAQQVRFGVRDQVIVFNGAPKNTSPSAAAAVTSTPTNVSTTGTAVDVSAFDGSRTVTLPSRRGVEIVTQPPPPPYLSAHAVSSSVPDVRGASTYANAAGLTTGQTESPPLLYVTLTSQTAASTTTTTATTLALPAGTHVVVGNGCTYPAAPPSPSNTATAAAGAGPATVVNAAGMATAVRVPAHGGPQFGTVTGSHVPSPPQRTSQPQLPQQQQHIFSQYPPSPPQVGQLFTPPPAEYYLLSSPSSLPTPPRGTVAPTPITTTFTTYSLNSPPSSSNLALLHPPLDGFSPSMPAQAYGYRGGNVGFNPNSGSSSSGATTALPYGAAANLDGRAVSGLPAFPSFGGSLVAGPALSASASAAALAGTGGQALSYAGHTPPSSSTTLMFAPSANAGSVSTVTAVPYLSVSDRAMSLHNSGIHHSSTTDTNRNSGANLGSSGVYAATGYPYAMPSPAGGGQRSDGTCVLPTFSDVSGGYLQGPNARQH